MNRDRLQWITHKYLSQTYQYQIVSKLHFHPRWGTSFSSLFFFGFGFCLFFCGLCVRLIYFYFFQMQLHLKIFLLMSHLFNYLLIWTMMKSDPIGMIVPNPNSRLRKHLSDMKLELLWLWICHQVLQFYFPKISTHVCTFAVGSLVLVALRHWPGCKLN